MNRVFVMYLILNFRVRVEAVMYLVCGRGYLLSFIGVLVCTAYSTLLERKLLAGAQRRKGPNKVR